MDNITSTASATIPTSSSGLEHYTGLFVFAGIAGAFMCAIPFLVGRNGIIRSMSWFRRST